MKHMLFTAAALLAVTPAAQAQLQDRFEVISARTSLPSPIRNSKTIAEARQSPELLISQKRYLEAITQYRLRVDETKQQNDIAGLESACTGLYRAQSLSLSKKPSEAEFSACPAPLVARLFGGVDREPMYLSYPVLEPSTGWLNTADPGTTYRVVVNFDISENGKARNFEFPVAEGYYLQMPVILALKNTRFLPALKDGQPVASQGNRIEVTFCLERGEHCESTQ